MDIWMCRKCYTNYVGEEPESDVCPGCATGKESPTFYGYYSIAPDGSTRWEESKDLADGQWYV
jgi:hypothetical protein